MAAVFADNGWLVSIADPAPERFKAAKEGIEKQNSAIALAGLAANRGGEIRIVRDTAAALPDADLVLECGPEDLAIKQKIFAELLAATNPNAILATMSSAISMSQIVTDPSQQARCLVAHPVNPPSVLRLIELCPAPGTDNEAMQRAKGHFTNAGFNTVILGREIEGFLLNRLQGSVLREAYRLVDEGIANPSDIDAVMRMGLGPRWALSGPFETAELNTPGGVAAHATRMGPAYKRMGESRGETVNWSPELVSRVVKDRDAERGTTTIPERAAWRSRAVARLVALRDQLLRDGV